MATDKPLYQPSKKKTNPLVPEFGKLQPQSRELEEAVFNFH